MPLATWEILVLTTFFGWWSLALLYTLVIAHHECGVRERLVLGSLHTLIQSSVAECHPGAATRFRVNDTSRTITEWLDRILVDYHMFREVNTSDAEHIRARVEWCLTAMHVPLNDAELGPDAEYEHTLCALGKLYERGLDAFHPPESIRTSAPEVQ